ncbi:MAG: serine/threonine-protein kinase [Gemmataceae bacterium]|nr:serine/threonine-protein kinase [Gemmataceae bacterium]
MTPPGSGHVPGSAGEQVKSPVRRLIKEMKRLRAAGQPAGARDVLARHPEIIPNRQLLVDLACEEFAQRRAAGEPLKPRAFAAGFPDCAGSLGALLSVRFAFEEEPELRAAVEVLCNRPEAGRRFAGFDLVRELGRGSFARVFLARQPTLDNREVVVKVTPFEGAAEAQTLASLRHPHIMPILSLHLDEQAGWTVVCMPYLGTATLDDLLTRTSGQLPTRASAILELARRQAPTDDPERPDPILQHGSYVEGVLRLGAGLAGAVAYLHDRGMCHRDLKPANVLLTPAGRPLLLDFNLSCAEGDAGQNVGGTLPYMAPEQLQVLLTGTKEAKALVGPRADLYALGVILYELLAGRHPFGSRPEGRSPREKVEWLLARQQRGYAPLRQFNPEVSRGVANLIERCMAPPAEQRPEAGPLARALEQALSFRSRLGRRLARHKRLLYAALVALACGSAAGVYALSGGEPASVSQYREGVAAYQRGHWEQAGRHFDDVLKQEGPSAPVLLARAKAYVGQGKVAFAMDSFREADRLGPDGKAKACLAYCCSRGPHINHDEALALNQKAIEEGHGTARVWNNLGWNYVRRPKGVNLDRARECFARALALDPTLQTAYHNRMQVALRLGAQAPWELLQEAVQDMKQAVALGPETAELYHDGARVCSLAMKHDPALGELGLSYLERAIRHGQDIRFLRRDGLLLPGLGQLPRFQQILTGTQTEREAVIALRVLDPIPDIPGPD